MGCFIWQWCFWTCLPEFEQPAAAYGFAVTGTMTITTILIGFVVVFACGWPLVITVPLIPFPGRGHDLFCRHIIKIPQAGGFRLVSH